MTANVHNQAPYLRTSRNFPDDNSQALSVEVNRSYIDIANKVNERTIGTYAVNAPVITGDRWFLSGASSRQQGLRQVYTFTAAGNIAHGINLSNISAFVKIYGTFTNGTNWYPLPYVDTNAAGNCISLNVTPTNIVITAGGGAPAITSGTIVLEWLSNV